MDISLSDLKLQKIRKEIPFTTIEGLPIIDNDEMVMIKIFNATGKKREELLEELKKNGDKIQLDNFIEDWYKYLLKNFTNIKLGKGKISEVFKSPKIELIQVKKELEAMVHEVYAEYLISQISEINNIKTIMYTDLLLKKTNEIQEVMNEIKEIDPEYGKGVNFDVGKFDGMLE